MSLPADTTLPADPTLRLEALRLEAIAPGYLGKARRAAQRLAHRNDAVIDVVTALADMEDASELDINVPTLSRLRVGRLVKVVVRRLVGWYLRYLTQQISAFSAAVNRFGAAVIDRTDRMEEATAAVASEVERLRRRVERLEQERPDAQTDPDARTGPDTQTGPDARTDTDTRTRAEGHG